MPFIKSKPRPFRAGARQIQAADLNMINERIYRQLRGGVGIGVNDFGDRSLVTVYDTPSINQLYTIVCAVIEEFDDYLLCLPLNTDSPSDLSEAPASLSTPPIYNADPQGTFPEERLIYITKPWLLQRTPFDGQTVTVDGVDITYDYPGNNSTSVNPPAMDHVGGERTATPDVGDPVTEKIWPPYIVGDIITAVWRFTGYYDPNSGNQTAPEAGAPLIEYQDLNESGRTWLKPITSLDNVTVSDLTVTNNLTVTGGTVTSTNTDWSFDTNSSLSLYTLTLVAIASGSVGTPPAGTSYLYERSSDGQLIFKTPTTEYQISGTSATDILVKVSSNDTTAGYLNGKLVTGNEIVFTENNDGGNETLTIALSAFSGVRAYHNTTQTVNSTNTGVLAMNQERYDTNTYHDLSTNNSRLTVPSAGKYHFGCVVEAGTSTPGVTGTWEIRLRISNGPTTISQVTVPIGTSPLTRLVSISADWDCGASEYVTVELVNNTSGTLTVATVEAWAHRIK